MIDFLLRAVDTVLDWRIERRARRNPYRRPVTGRCAETSHGERCRLARGHLVQHLSATRTWPRANTCSVHCRPSCSYPKCEES